MVRDLAYSTVSSITDSWEALRQIPDYQNTLGISLFKKLFTKEPECTKIFRFSREEFLEEDFFKSQRLHKHAMLFVNMLDRAVQLLGPDLELLTESLLDLGEMHNKMGVEAAHYYFMGDSLLQSLEEMLDPEMFDEEMKRAWREVFTSMAYDMIRGRTADEEHGPSSHPGRRLSTDNFVLITPDEELKILGEMIQEEIDEEVDDKFLAHPGRRLSGDSLTVPRRFTTTCAEE